MAKRIFSLARVYQLLEPGPVVLLTTAGKARPNVMTLSWHTMMEFEPPLVGCVISDRNYTYGLLRKSRECVINIPTVELAEKVVACGNSTGRRQDKFAVCGLTPKAASRVRAPLIDECYASLECRIADGRLAARYSFFVLEVVRAWVDRAHADPKTLHHRGYGTFMVSGDTIRLPSRMK